MAPNAAVGSSKNITPNWLTARSKGASSSGVVCTSISTKRTLGTPDRSARRRANSSRGAEMSIPTTCPSGATASASAMVRAPPPQPMSHTRWPVRTSAVSRR